MADGFKKYFNGTTLNGRANVRTVLSIALELVAKATYATLALLFIVYKLRRGSGKAGELASGKCSCESDHGSSLNGDVGVYGVDPDCSVCRERADRAMSEFDREQQRRAAGEDGNGCRDDPPPPPPPPASGGSGSAARRKCPCEEPQRRAEGAAKHSSHSSRSGGHQIQPPHQYQQYTQPEPEQVRPASQVLGQVHDAFFRVLRGVVGAILGNAAVNTSGTATYAPAQPVAVEVSRDELDDEEFDDDQDDEVPLKRRTAPRSCVPTRSQPKGQKQAGAQPQSDEQAEYSAFNDGFTSGLYFADEK